MLQEQSAHKRVALEERVLTRAQRFVKFAEIERLEIAPHVQHGKAFVTAQRLQFLAGTEPIVDPIAFAGARTP